MNEPKLKHELRMKPDWVDFSGTGDPALDSTFAYLDLLLDDQSILTVLDKRANTTSSRVLVPVYALAEWMAATWWSLLEEPLAPGSMKTGQDYAARHSFRFAGEGFAFPDVRLIPEGPVVRVEWRPLATSYQSVDFLSENHVHLLRDEAEQFLTDMIELVLTRLQSRGITESWLATEWSAIRSQEKDEADFCRVVGRLGLDPFDLDDVAADQIASVWDALPASVRPAVFEAVDVSALCEAATWVNKGIRDIRDSASTDGFWTPFRKLATSPIMDLPWREGHRLAETARKLLELEDTIPVPIDRLPIPVIDAPRPPVSSLDAVIAMNSKGAACCYTGRRRSHSRRFLQARAIMEMMFGGHDQPTLLSSAVTAHQQRSRAFAAELLAPTDVLRDRIAGRTELSEEDVSDLAAEFDVSTFVIEHQVANHTLAEIAKASISSS